MESKKIYLLILIFFAAQFTFSQSKDVVSLKIDSNFDIRKTAAQYFSNADLWPYILKYNNLSRLDEIKPGTTLLIPQKKVSTLLSMHDKAKESLQRAVLIGAKVLSIETLSQAEEALSSALKQKESLEYDLSIQSAQKAYQLAEAAYKQTKEIRDKTIDAIVSYKKGTLQKRFINALSWQSAELYENLKENDMARTLALSLARITFNDLSQIKLNENSMAVIQRSRIDPLTNKTTSQVKLEKGDAYASLLNSPKKKFDIEIPGVKTEINSKYFWVEKNTDETKLANYNGEIKLGVKDSSVVVRKNQGSIIPSGGMPSKPSELLPPPILISPQDQNKYDNVSVVFNWQAVPNADSYWLQIGYDSGFNNVFLLHKELKEGKAEVDINTPGTYYWRVCSVDKNGLPGIYSPSNGFVLFNNNVKPYLVLDNPAKEIFTSKKLVKITGKTLAECNVMINNVKVIPDREGKFESNYNLEEGKNVILIRAVDQSGNESLLYQTVYLESNPDVELNYTDTGKKLGGSNIFTNKDNLIINLSTRPFAQATFLNKLSSEKEIYFADSLGRFSASLNAKNSNTPFSVKILTKAGFEKTREFNLLKDTDAPKIFLNSISKVTSSPMLKISGKVEGAKSFFINGRNETIKPDNSFEISITLSNGKNEVELIAEDEAGNISKQMEVIILDTEPPKLESANILRDKKGIASIIVKAKDETDLTNYAGVEYRAQNKIVKDLLKYNKIKLVYELEITDSPDIKIITVELSDYLMNKKVYSTN